MTRLALVLFATLALACPAVAAVGDRDQTYNNGNVILIDTPPPPAGPGEYRWDTMREVVVDSSGRATAGGNAGRSAGDFGFLARRENNGGPDTSFDGDGLVLASQYEGAVHVGIMGVFRNSTGRLGAGLFADSKDGAAAYLQSGALDGSYGTNGLGLHEADDAILVRVVATPDGAAYLIYNNTLRNDGDETGIDVARVDPDGHYDATYGTQTFDIPRDGINPPRQSRIDAAVDAQGRVVIVATDAHNDPASEGRRGIFVMRLGPDGLPDPAFGGGDGRATFWAGGSGVGRWTNAVTLAPDGDIVVTGGYSIGSFPRGPYALKINPDGTPDPVFGGTGSGVAAMELEGFPDATAVAVQADGKVVLAAGAEPVADAGRLYLIRYTTGGLPDTTFVDADPGSGEPDGVKKHDEIGRIPRVDDITVAPNGKLLVAGTFSFPSTDDTRAFLSRFILQDTTLAPDNTKRPGITGVPKPGESLTCTPGVWTNTPSISVIWDRAPRGTSSDEDPAWLQVGTGTSYPITDLDAGSRLRCRENASNANGSAFAVSASKRVDADVPVLVRAPTLSGLPVTGERLTCDTGEWSNAPDITVRWLRDGGPIAEAIDRSYTVRFADRHAQVGCEVTAVNDVGPAAQPARSSTMLAVHDIPVNLGAPVAVLQSTGPKPTDQRVACQPGTWEDDYQQYRYSWEREGAEIAGATGPTYDATIDDLGRNIVCVVVSTNPKGDSTPARSASVLVPLPAGGVAGQIYEAGGFNRLDPTSLLAVSKEFLDVTRGLVVKRREATAAALTTSCRTGEYANEPYPTGKWEEYVVPGKKIGTYVGDRRTCALLLRAPQEIVHTYLGSRWVKVPGACRLPTEPSSGLTPCPSLAISVPPLNQASLAQASPAEQAEIAQTRPVTTLWDFDSDGRTDAECDPDAPILRSLYSRGIYNVRAVIINANSDVTGVYSVTDHVLDHYPESSSQRGALRSAQPFACKTSMTPPPEPQLPCVGAITIGRAHMTGNMCPISARRIPENELNGLPLNVQRMLEDQALNSSADLRVASLPGDEQIGGLPAGRQAPLSRALAPISALAQIDQITKPQAIATSWLTKLKNVPSFNVEKAQHAMDQIYVAKGTTTLNGVQMDPVGGALTLLVPSDAGEAIEGVKQMTLSSTNIATTLSGIPIGQPGRLVSDFKDKVETTAKAEAEAAAKAVLKGANLDELANNLKSKLDLGPFKLAGDAKVKLNADGTATIDAWAELPGLLTKPGSKPIRIGVQVNATRSGQLRLNGVHLSAPSAFLGGVLLKDLALDYDGSGLSVKGQLLFPPINSGIALNKFRLGPQGQFQELDVDYLAGSGQGIPLGYGLFMTKIGGGLSLDPDEIRARTAISVGPSSGGGCPTVGMDAQFVVHFAPSPFFVDATGTVGLVCIPLGSTHFYADQTGLIDVSANVSIDIGPLYYKSGLAGRIQLPKWQISMRGEGGIRHVIEVTIKALIGNLGIAGCGRLEVFPETPVSDSVTIAAGAGVRFSAGPPINFPALVAGARVFTGCNLSSWSPFGRDIRQAGGGGRTFTLGDEPVVALELIGEGGAPRVKLRAPDGSEYDASGFGEDFVKTDNLSGLIEPANSRTVLWLRGQKGNWTVTPVPGSPALADIRKADVLPEPKVTAKVGGAGASRILRYKIAKLPGQVVTFKEQAAKGQRLIKTVKGGGRGKARFLTSEGGGTARTIVAEVAQDGLPRDNLTVAKFNAPSPRAGKAPKLRIRRRGTKATVKWGKATYTKSYLVVVERGDGSRTTYSRSAKQRTLSFGGLSKGEGTIVSVTSQSPSGLEGATARATLRGDKTFSSFKNEKRKKLKRGKKRRKRV